MHLPVFDRTGVTCISPTGENERGLMMVTGETRPLYLGLVSSYMLPYIFSMSGDGITAFTSFIHSQSSPISLSLASIAATPPSTLLSMLRGITGSCSDIRNSHQPFSPSSVQLTLSPS